MNAPQAILIAGPTASGKSALAISLAQELGGEILNADSMQVYADFRILTARPSLQEEALAPHALFGHVDGGLNYSVGGYLRDAQRAVGETLAKGRLPIFTGGTGMYFKALTQGLSRIPPVPAEVRERVRKLALSHDVAALHARLQQVDPEMAARLRPTDPQRILRALEVFETTGRSLAAFQGERVGAQLDATRCVNVFLHVERATLTARIDRRFDTMMQQGAMAEVERLAARRLDPALPVMRAHGAPALLAALAGQMPLAEAVERGKIDTRRYAKRQHTFARHQLPEFDWVTPEDAQAHVLQRFEAMTKASGGKDQAVTTS